MKKTDQRFTPEWLLDLVRDFAGGDIPIDVATEARNPCQALEWITRDREYRRDQKPVPKASVGSRWRSDMANGSGSRLAWCNPPYSRGSLPYWAGKAVEQAREGAEILMLTRADTRTGWFTRLRSNMDAVCFPSRSIGFVHPEKGQLPGDTVGHALWYFGPQRARFRRVFEQLVKFRRGLEPLGWVLDGPGPQELSEEMRRCLGKDREVDHAAE